MQTVTRPSSQTVSQAVSQSGPPDHHWIGMPANSRFMAFVRKVYIKVIGKTFFFLKRKNKYFIKEKLFLEKNSFFYIQPNVPMANAALIGNKIRYKSDS